MQKTMNFNVSIVSFEKSDYIFHFKYMNKDDAISIIKNSDVKKMVATKMFVHMKNRIIKLLTVKKTEKEY